AGLFLVGLPLYHWLRKTGRLDLLKLTVCGAVGGVAFLVVFSAILVLIIRSPYTPLTLRDLILDLGWGIILGAAVAVTFGLIAGVPGRIRHAHAARNWKTSIDSIRHSKK